MTIPVAQRETMMAKYCKALVELDEGNPFFKAGLAGGAVYCGVWLFTFIDPSIDPSNMSFYGSLLNLIRDCVHPIFDKVPYVSNLSKEAMKFAAVSIGAVTLTNALGYPITPAEAACTVAGLSGLAAASALFSIVPDYFTVQNIKNIFSRKPKPAV